MSKTQGTFVYIDGSNLNQTLYKLGYKGIDYASLINWLKTKHKATRVYLYAGYGSEKERASLEKLKKHGYIVDMKKVKQYPDEVNTFPCECPDCGKKHDLSIRKHGRRKANCDAELTLDVINDGVRKKYSEIIVFSGDGDFGRVYKYVSDQLGRGVTVFAPMGSIAGNRTSTIIKELHKTGIIKLNALESILGPTGYGIKK